MPRKLCFLNTIDVKASPSLTPLAAVSATFSSAVVAFSLPITVPCILHRKGFFVLENLVEHDPATNKKNIQCVLLKRFESWKRLEDIFQNLFFFSLLKPQINACKPLKPQINA